MFDRLLFGIGITILQLDGMDNDGLCDFSRKITQEEDRHVNKNHPTLKSLNSVVMQESQKILDGLIANPDITNVKTDIERIWVNNNFNKDITIPHAHRDSFLSAVYYPKSTDGKLFFYSPFSDSFLAHVPIKKAKEYHAFNSTYFEFEVKTGWLVLFNSMLPHYVPPFSDEERISIVYDIRANEVSP